MSNAQPSLRSPKSPPREAERRFFFWTASAILLLVFIGFSRTYFLHKLFGRPEVSRFLSIHGAVMSGWILLFFVQTALISARRVNMHRILGYFGAGYAAIVVLFGCTATVLSARREVRGHTTAVFGFLNVLALELTQMLLFATLVSLAVCWRNRLDYHKRLMLLATLCILPNVFVRLFISVVDSNLGFLAIWTVPVVGLVLLDSIRNRKLHPAFSYGAPIVLAVMYAAYFVGNTEAWRNFAARSVG